jgi:uncharacterized membrane protein
MQNPRTIHTLILASTLAWCGAIVLAPLLGGPADPISRGIYAFFHLICHQIDDRSLHLAGHPLAVCSRCSAIYFAFLAGVILFPFVRLSGSTRRLLILAAVPMVVDVAVGMLGLYEPSNVLRVASGAVFGVLAALIILPDAIQGTQVLILKHRHATITQTQGDTDATKTQ